jgi:hypothetical protein
MKPAADKHYKFINSETGYIIFYHTLNGKLAETELKAELEKVKAQVAINNRIFLGTVYWEEIKDEDEGHADGAA